MKFLYFILLLFIFSTECFSASKVVSVPVAVNDDDIEYAKGIFYSNEELKLIDAVRVSKYEEKVLVSFDIDGKNEDFVGAFVKDNEGNIIYSKMIPFSDFFKEKVELPWCDHQKINIPLIAGQESLLIELVNNRNQQVQGYNEKTRTLLEDQDFLNMLSTLEKYFGFVYDKPLSANLDANELLIRLKNIEISLHKNEVNKTQRVRVERNTQGEN